MHAPPELFSLLVASVRDYAIFMLDPNGLVATWNAGAERIKGYAADEIIGRHFSAFYPAEDVRRGKCEWELELATRDGRFEDENWRVRKDGTQFWANVIITAMYDDSGVLVGFAKVTRDLTERKRGEEERAALLASQEANRAKDEFLAMLGHELRNPLAPIVTALQLIKLRGEPRSQKEYQVIERQVQHMMRLVDDLLDISRISSGKIELRKQAIDVRDPIVRAVEIASPLIEQKNHHFEVKVPPTALRVEGDESRLVQVFTNLLMNAAKYTDAGGTIVLRVRHVRSEIIVDISDNGIGIDRDLLPRVFELFVQGYQRSDRAAGGLGLGLTLVKSLVELHGGRVDARSQGPKQGSTFTVRLPALTVADAEVPAETIATAFQATDTKWRILIVDDNEDARMLLADILGALGHSTRTAQDGEQALAMAREYLPQVAILDIGLPGMDGYELARRLRDIPQLAATKLIALSGYGSAADQERSRAAGFDRHIIKPVEVRRLVATIAELQ
jgi:PAS domain S-box-containing protein